MAKQKFIPLNKLLLEDNEEVKKIKSLKDREEEHGFDFDDEEFKLG